jgi:serine/threonine protein kinase
MLKSMRNRGAGREEFEILSGLNHENVIRYTASELFEFERCQFFGIFMPFYRCRDMQSYIEGHLRANRPRYAGGERWPLVFISQLIYGLSYLHENGIIHRDIKPSNLFRTEAKRLVIGDFDIAGKFRLSK